jgi:hypothetical protein
LAIKKHLGKGVFGFWRGGDWCCMREDQQQFLTLVGQPPARLTVEQAAWVLNCQPHDVPVLVSSRLLKPLGNPPANGIKFFATVDVLELVKDRSWLAKMTNTVNQHWQKKNACKKSPSRNGSENGHSSLLSLSAVACR